jgi:diguanylate cyclase (GGDEF)-like protein
MMAVYFILAAVSLAACSLMIGGIYALFPTDPSTVLWGIGVYLALGPILFLIPFRGRRSKGSPGGWIPVYAIALILAAMTAAFSFEFNRQLVLWQYPLVFVDPQWITLLFFVGYLPAALLLCMALARTGRAPEPTKRLLLTSGTGIPLPPPGAQSIPEPLPVSTAEPPFREAAKNHLTSVPPAAINESSSLLAPEWPVLMETIELSRLKEIQDRFSSLTNLSVLTYDDEGRLVCEPSGENPICRIVQETEKGRRHCLSHCGRSIGRALEDNEPVFFKCEMNLHVFSIPIAIDPRTRMVVQGGKSFVDPQEFADSHAKAAELEVSMDSLTDLADRLRVHDNLLLSASAKFLASVLPYLLSTLHEKNTLSTQLARLMTLFMLTIDLKNDRSQITTTLLNTLGILFNLNSASVLQWDRRQQMFMTTATFGPIHESLRRHQTAAESGLVRRLLLLDPPRPISTDETLEILRSGFPADLLSVHLFPLFTHHNQISGLLCVFDTALKDDEIQVVDAFCQQASIVQENALLQRERQDLAQDVFVLLEIAKAVGSAMDSEELFSIILDKSTEFLHAEQGSIMLLDEERRVLTVKAMKGLNKKIVELLKIRPGEGISGRVLSTGSPIVVADIEADSRLGQTNRPRYKTKSFISIPLKLEGRTIGVLNVADKLTGEVYSEDDLQLLTSIGTYASIAIERSKFYQQTEELKRISITDALTGLLNRRYFQERMSEEIERSRRHHLPLSLIMIDVDDFKSVNDSLGHPAGDEVLKMAARCIRNCIRTIDVAARYGGEEFTVILPQTTKVDAQTIAERICSEVFRIDLPFSRADQKLVISVSLGLATYPEDAESLEDLVRNADIALFSAKSQGKNRVVVYGR